MVQLQGGVVPVSRVGSMAVFVKYGSEHFGAAELAFYRSLATCLVAYAALRAARGTIRSEHTGTHLVRGIVGALSLVGYFYAMPVEAMAREAGGVPQHIMAAALGPVGATLIGVAIMCSVFGALNGNVLAKPRVAYALSREYFDLAAMRFRSREEAKAFRKANQGAVFTAGLLIAAFVSIPIVNLAAPLFATALMVHVHKRVAQHGRRNRSYE